MQRIGPCTNLIDHQVHHTHKAIHIALRATQFCAIICEYLGNNEIAKNLVHDIYSNSASSGSLAALATCKRVLQYNTIEIAEL